MNKNINNISKDEILDEMLKTLGVGESFARLVNILTPIELKYYWTKIKDSLQSEKDASKIHVI